MKPGIAWKIVLLIFGLAPCVWAISFEELEGEEWYGLYMNGDKIGFARNWGEVLKDGRVVLSQDATFRLTMVGQKQSMRTASSRTYDADGKLLYIESRVNDASGRSSFVATVDGDKLRLNSMVGGEMREQILPKPKESLEDALRTVELVLGGPEIGETVEFHMFEPMFGRELTAKSEVIEVEERMFDGVATRVYGLKTIMKELGIESISYISESGDLLEDRIAGLIVMRLEPEEMAKDVTYRNDTIVSNAALVTEPIQRARDRESLTLKIAGPLNGDHTIEDARQSFSADGDAFVFKGAKIAAGNIEGATLPIANEEVSEWLKPSMLVQSDDPRLVEKAREIVGGETDALAATGKLIHWVHENMRPTFSARLTNSLEVLDSLEGDCTEHSMLFVGLARAAGLPAREVAGLIYVDMPRPGFYFHQWAKVWLGEWVDVDPTFGQVTADATHIKLAEGDIMQQTKLLPVIGQLVIEILDK